MVSWGCNGLSKQIHDNFRCYYLVASNFGLYVPIKLPITYHIRCFRIFMKFWSRKSLLYHLYWWYSQCQEGLYVEVVTAIIYVDSFGILANFRGRFLHNNCSPIGSPLGLLGFLTSRMVCKMSTGMLDLPILDTRDSNIHQTKLTFLGLLLIDSKSTVLVSFCSATNLVTVLTWRLILHIYFQHTRIWNLCQ
jgi:hypothetical protein